MGPKYINRLIHEASPYLLQHAHNPVDWYPWGEEALSRAKKEDKPILLSIGYSSCHWCHVMERECFENETIARLMNERFINIKVDREERPDLDELYMKALHLMTGSGGWPMTVFLTPDLIPFHGGTYFPAEDRMGLPGFQKVLRIVSDYYRTRRNEIVRMETQMREALREAIKVVPSEKALDPLVFSKAFELFKREFDPLYGGFGKAPKFPNPLVLTFLLRYWKSSGAKEALRMVETTLEKMAEGGIHDHLGGGFHRYSVDEQWRVPHFEKMLYDNALLSQLFFETYRSTRKEGYRRIGEEILIYILREMSQEEGGFYSAQDADSEGEEGKFYLWTKEEIRKILGEEKGELLSAYYGVTSHGNFEKGRNILHVTSSLEKISREFGISLSELRRNLEEGQKRLFLEREKRIRPHRDEKIITSWNGLMISGLVYGFVATGDRAYLQSAQKAVQFILKRLSKGRDLMRLFYHGRVQGEGYSEDYAFFIQALLDLYEATMEREYLTTAYELNQVMIERFWDDRSGGFFFSRNEVFPRVGRSKNPYDQVIPSPNSVAVMNLVRLGSLKKEDSLKEKAERTLRLFYDYLLGSPSGFSHLLTSFLFFLNPSSLTSILSPPA